MNFSQSLDECNNFNFTLFQESDDNDQIDNDEDDLIKDPDFEYLDYQDLGPIPEEMKGPVKAALRFTQSSFQTMLIINATLKMVKRDDLMISR